jgi:hypothetical protein
MYWLFKSAMNGETSGTIDGGTKPIKNKGSKKNGLVIGKSTKDICFKYRYNFKIMMTVSGHTII